MTEIEKVESREVREISKVKQSAYVMALKHPTPGSGQGLP